MTTYSHAYLAALARRMADTDATAEEIAYAIEKPWKHEDELRAASLDALASDGLRDTLDAADAARACQEVREERDDLAARTPAPTTCECEPCPGRGTDGHGMEHCAECCFGTHVIAEIDCPVHGERTPAPAPDRDALAGLDLSNLRAVAEDASPGPWETFQDYSRTILVRARGWGDVAEFGADSIVDAEHVATFDPPTVLALLAAIAERDDLRGALPVEAFEA